jgi:chromosome segregation ATPase
VNENNPASFDRMRTMLVRAAEIREGEQQQVFDALDEIHAKLAPLESLGSMRKRLADLPERSEVGAIAQRLDETVAKLEASDAALARLGSTVDGIVDKLATPLAQLDGRLDGMAGRFEGVAGRMDGLEDRLSHVHGRLDDLESRLEKLDATLDAARQGHASALGELRESLESSTRETTASLHGKVDDSREQLAAAVRELRDGVDPAERLESLTSQVDALATSMQSIITRVGTVETAVETLGGSLAESMTEMQGALAARPDSDAVAAVIRTANAESEQRNAGQLDEAMATFAELILGGGNTAPGTAATAPAPARSQRRRNGSGKPRSNAAQGQTRESANGNDPAEAATEEA